MRRPSTHDRRRASTHSTACRSNNGGIPARSNPDHYAHRGADGEANSAPYHCTGPHGDSDARTRDHGNRDTDADGSADRDSHAGRNSRPHSSAHTVGHQSFYPGINPANEHVERTCRRSRGPVLGL